ncbi:MAG: peptidoglycan-binding protein [Leptolyngbya sp. SIO3F4]|nr:peptidoglycan-binding protein [Leptolyngbya sp. SIO3F4]
MTSALAAVDAKPFFEQSDNSSSHSKLIAQIGSVLELGSEGAVVKDLQAMLSLLGYYLEGIDGTYGNATADAVRRFQADVGLTADGVVGPATWQKLLPTPIELNQPQEANSATATREPLNQTPNSNTVGIRPQENSDVSGSVSELSILRLDDYGPDVGVLQRRLAELSFYAGSVDGVFGLQTMQAVEQFQRQAGLDVDGVVGPATWTKLLQ